jgi:shikimate kinase
LNRLKRPVETKNVTSTGSQSQTLAVPGAKAPKATAGPSVAASRATLKGGKVIPAGKKAGPVSVTPTRVVFLIGYTGSGKSTVGRLLAIRMGNHFVDLEQEISQRVGMAIPMIFNRVGEEGFRSLEAAILEKILAPGEHEALIVATGDGIVDSPKNIEFMRQRGLVCFLHATFEEVARRLGSEVPVRPIWHNKDLLVRNYDMRAKLYSGAAHVMLETDHRDPSQIVLELAQKLDEFEKSKSRGKGSRRARSS